MAQPLHGLEHPGKEIPPQIEGTQNSTPCTSKNMNTPGDEGFTSRKQYSIIEESHDESILTNEKKASVLAERRSTLNSIYAPLSQLQQFFESTIHFHPDNNNNSTSQEPKNSRGGEEAYSVAATFPDLHVDVRKLLQRVASLREFYAFLSTTQAAFSLPDAGYFCVLPTEIIVYVLRLLPVNDIANLSQVSKDWNKLANDELLWQQLVERDFQPLQTERKVLLKKPACRTWKWLYECNFVQFTRKMVMKTSPGTYVYFPDGHIYIGDWKDDVRHGYGVYMWRDNKRYEGEWIGDKRNNYGRYVYPDGTSYEGQWKDDKRDGIGTYSWPDGRQYTGNWLNHRKNGHGVHIWRDGSRYIGEWQDGSRNGKGTFYWSDGRKYEGEWKNGKIQGSGTFVWPDGDCYIGQWVDGKRWGSGIFVDGDGNIYQQEWGEAKFDKTNKGPKGKPVGGISGHKRKATESAYEDDDKDEDLPERENDPNSDNNNNSNCHKFANASSGEDKDEELDKTKESDEEGVALGFSSTLKRRKL